MEGRKVRTIQLRVDNVVFEKLKKMKGKKTWEQFLIEPLVQEEVK